MNRSLLPGAGFARGVNLPWLSYGNDFGCSAWHPAGGLGATESARRLDVVLERLARSGACLVRWFLLCDGRAGLCEDSGGLLEGPDNRLTDDFEVAVRAAEAHGLALIPVLLDFHWCRPRHDEKGVQLAGRAAHLADRNRRARLMQRVFRPLLERFGGRPGIAAWDLMNEPDWVTLTWEAWNPFRAVRPGVMCDYIGEAAALVHELTDHPVTVGLASAASLRHVRGLRLDLYDVHWYDHLEGRAPLTKPVAEWGVDGPVILGEFPTRGMARSPEAIEAAARASGYDGVLAWSLQAEDTASGGEALWRWLEGGGSSDRQLASQEAASS